MELLLDHVHAGGTLARDGANGAGSGLALLMDELAHGVLVTSLENQVLHANQAARHELARGRVLGVRNQLLHGCTAADGKTLEGAVAKAGQGKRSLVTLQAADGFRLTMAVIPLRADHPAGPPKAAFMFSRASVCESLMLCFFARSYSLTATEEHVLGIVCQGYSAPEVAAQLKVAVSTVRSHIRSLCSKTRSSGVRELVNRVAVLPPVAPTLRHEVMH
ncbi:MAG: helix-turn-helix transcriptional regulator [Pseudomonadota bacterium]|nr:helix-turn-helix transcriptional regulator [Pseudomonadota bacterium]